jgi:hypothetical protein
LKIQVVIPLWKRPEITRFCFQKLKKLIAETQHELGVLCVISETEYIEMCTEFGFTWIYAENNPLGDKINQGLRVALDFKPDYIMIMNSDSVVKAELLDKWYKPHFENREEFFGVDTVTYLDSVTGEARRMFYDFTILGVAKMIRADIVQRCLKCLGEVYRKELNKCLDNTMMDNMMRIESIDHPGKRISPKMIKYKGQLVFDVKSEVNIWPWKAFEKKGEKVESELCYKAESGAENLTER